MAARYQKLRTVRTRAHCRESFVNERNNRWIPARVLDELRETSVVDLSEVVVDVVAAEFSNLCAQPEAARAVSRGSGSLGHFIEAAFADEESQR